MSSAEGSAKSMRVVSMVTSSLMMVGLAGFFSSTFSSPFSSFTKEKEITEKYNQLRKIRFDFQLLFFKVISTT